MIIDSNKTNHRNLTVYLNRNYSVKYSFYANINIQQQNQSCKSTSYFSTNLSSTDFQNGVNFQCNQFRKLIIHNVSVSTYRGSVIAFKTDDNSNIECDSILIMSKIIDTCFSNQQRDYHIWFCKW